MSEYLWVWKNQQHNKSTQTEPNITFEKNCWDKLKNFVAYYIAYATNDKRKTT